MQTLAHRVEAAIKASGKKAAQVAREAGTSERNLSNIVTGANRNPGYELLEGIAKATRTTVGALAGNSIQLSTEDDEALLRFRKWIDEKLATIDARTEPNAEVLSSSATVTDAKRIADRRSAFGEAKLVLRAIGDSMRDAGILAGDTLYATTRPRSADDSAMGKIIACRIGDDVFVKRLTSERRQHFLLSANPRYRAIVIAPEDPEFEILGIVIGRTGPVK